MTSSSDPTSQNVDEHVQNIPKEAVTPHDSSGGKPPVTILEDRKTSIAADSDTEPQTQAAEVERPYSSFTKNEKWFIVILAAIGGIFRYSFCS